MILLLDIGNTRLKWGWLQSGTQLLPGGVVVHGFELTGLQEAWADQPRPRRVVAASVAGERFNNQLSVLVKFLWGVQVEWARSGESVAQMLTVYPEPQRLGVDRWAAAVGAYLASKRAVCVVDCGSAITFDAVTAEGKHLGGLIVPGWRLMRLALHQGTAGLPFVEADEIRVIASDTASAIGSGTLLGAAAMVDGLAQRIVDSMEGEVELWLTGGDAIFLQSQLSLPFTYAPDLVLQGLAAISAGL